jgi:hypothetical protein
MQRLNQLQHRLREAIMAADADGTAVRVASKTVNATRGLSSPEHLRIYRRAVTGTFTRALSQLYPVTMRLLGQQFFDGMVCRYMRITPSLSPDLADYGSSFAEFIEGFEPAAGLPYLPDVARLEWAWHRAFSAADETALNIDALSEVPESDRARLLFALPASASLLASQYPVQRIWQVNQEDWSGSEEVNLDEGAARLIIWRRGYDMRIDSLHDSEWSLLSALTQNMPMRKLSRSFPDMATLLPHCVEHGWIAGFKLGESTD